MLKRKCSFAKLLLTAVFLPLVSYAQIRSVDREIAWTHPFAKVSNDSMIRNLSFDGAIYSSSVALPTWSETFFGVNSIKDFALTDCVFIQLTPDEMMQVKQTDTPIPVNLWYTVKKAVSRRQEGYSLEILPFIADSASHKLMKLVSFKVTYSEFSRTLKNASKTYAAHSVLAKGNWYKLAISHSGVYSLTYSDLMAMGINPATLNPAKIGIFGRGGTMLPEPNSAVRYDDLPENAIEVIGSGDGSFDQNDLILFYAQGPITWKYNNNRSLWEHTTHLYADTVCYFLTSDQGSGKRITALDNNTAAETQTVTGFDFYTSFEENNFNLIKSGRQWFAQNFDIITNKSYSFDLPALADGGEVKIRSVTAAKSIVTSSFSFAVGSQSWTVNQSPVSGYVDSPVATGATNYRTLQNVALPLRIDIKYNKTSSTSAGYLDMLDVNARCLLRFTGGEMEFSDSHSTGVGQVAKYRLSDAAAKARIWEITNPLIPASITASVIGNDLVFTQAADSIRQFIAFDDTRFLKPRFVNRIQNQDLHSVSGTDMIIIAPQQFMQQAIRLAKFHSMSSGLDVLVLDPVTIYNEFSSGTIDITAIRDFLRLLYEKSSQGNMPKYLLLFGDASYDYKDKIPSNTNFVPSWQSPESYSPISSLVSDDYFGMLDANEGQSYADVIDIGIGRLPVKTPREAEEAVDKIIHYSTSSTENSGDWRNVITFVADDEDLNDHIAQAEQMAQDIETRYPETNLDKIYLDSYVQASTPEGNRYPDVNKAITQRIEKGCLILNYTGHGGETGLAHEQVLMVNDINNWSNFNNLPVFVTATCEFSRFDDPVRQAAGEMVLTNPAGGGIALFTTTRPTYGTPNFELNKKFYQYALSKPDGERLRMGDIIMNSKRDKGSNENGRKYVLLGDPALKISFPELSVVTKSINGHAPGNSADTLKAYMEVNIEGLIADGSGNQVVDFNGTLFTSVFDKASTLKTLANDGGSTYTFRLRKNLLYKGKVVVSGGRFSFTFIVPKDISYNFDFGKISFYATDGSRDASGAYSNVVVGGSSKPDVTDDNGPEIKLYMNSTSFIDGGITDQNPRLLAQLNDANGINTIGNGIGHDITAVLDGNTSEPYILNDFYVSDIDTYRSGHIWFPFSMLAPGDHTLIVKVWDVFNNSSDQIIHFTVFSSGELVIKKTFNFPNPFTSSTDIVFEHNQQNVEFALRAEIYSLSGQLVRVIEQTSEQVGSVSTPLHWNGLNEQGSRVPAGIYVYNLTVRTSGGLFAQTSGKMILR